jgi:hypothetical protein
VDSITPADLTEATSSVLTITGGTDAVLGSGTTIQVKQAGSSQSGFLSSTDWTTFNSKQDTITNPVTGTGASGQVAYFNGTNSITSESNLFWDATNNRLGVGIATPSNTLDVIRGTAGAMGRGVYESASFSFNGDMKLGLYTSAAAGLGGASLIFGATNFTAGGNYPGFEVQFVPSATLASNYIRFNSVSRNATGTVVSSTPDILSIFQAGNVVIGSGTNAGFRLDVNGTARVQGNLNVSTGGVTLTGAQTIQTSTGNLTLATAGGDGNIILSPNGVGKIGFNLTTPLTKFHFVSSNTSIPNQTYTNSGESRGLGINAYASNSNNFRRVVDFVAYSQNFGIGRPSMFRFFAQGNIVNGEPIEILRFGSAVTTTSEIRFGFLTDSPTQTLDVNGTGRIRNGVSLADTSGNVQIGTTTDAGFRLDVNGTARVQGVLTTTADAVVNGVNIGRGGGNLDTNTRVGANAGAANTTGVSNSFFGTNSGALNTTGSTNSSFGRDSLSSNTTGGLNSAYGSSSLDNNTTGAENTAIGVSALFSNTTGSQNTAIGRTSGRFIADGITENTLTNNSVFLGAFSRAAANNQTNQIVIGHTAIGLGSNTTVIGNSSTTFGRWYGSLLLGTTTNAASSILTMESTTQGFLPPRMTTTEKNAIASPATGLVVYDNTLNKLSVFTGVTWETVTSL